LAEGDGGARLVKLGGVADIPAKLPIYFPGRYWRYIGRLYIEAKKRPLYFIDEIKRKDGK